MGCLELSDDSSNTSEINSDSVDYANHEIKTFVSNQTLKEVVLSANHIFSNIKGDFLFDPYLKELPSD